MDGIDGKIRGNSVRIVFIISPLVALLALVGVGYIANTSLQRVTSATEQALNDAMSRALVATEQLSQLRNANLQLYETIALRAAETPTLDVASRISAIEAQLDDLIATLGELAVIVPNPRQSERLLQATNDLATQRDAMIFVGGMLEIDFAAVITFIEPFGAHLDRIQRVLNTVADGEVDRANRALTETVLQARQDSNLQTTLLAASIMIVAGVTLLGGRFFSRAMATIERVTANLKRSEAQLSDMIDECPLLLMIVEADGTIRKASSFAADNFSYQQNEMIGSNLRNLLVDADDLIVDDVLSQTGPGTITRTVQMKRRDGSLIWSRQSARRFTVESGERCVLLMCEDITDVKAMSDKLAYQARYDQMTGFLKREPFVEHLEEVLEKREPGTAVCFIDVDRFKLVNDVYGHAAGDHVLVELARSVVSALGEKDLCGRWGGDEFAVLLRCTDERDIAHRAEKIRQAVAGTDFTCDGQTLDVTISVGVCIIDESATTVAEVLAQADASCYAAKSAGRDAVCFSTDAHDEAMGREALVLRHVENCIANDTLKLFAQPFATLSDSANAAGKHFEILSRIEGPDGKPILPSVFIPLLERFDMMPSFDMAVMRKTIDLLSAMDAQDLPNRCFVNVSRQSFKKQSFTGELIDLLSSFKSETCGIVIELTEIGVNDGADSMVEVLQKLRAAGCEVAIDDFGRGQSTLLSLVQLEADYVKLDGSLIRDLHDNERNLAVVKASVAMGQELGCCIVAEWVENAETFDLLKWLDVDLVQGYYHHRPVPIEQLCPSITEAVRSSIAENDGAAAA
ncbi:MAG: EAL domain-containing protein [Pseudomonadota bacterium]